MTDNNLIADEDPSENLISIVSSVASKQVSTDFSIFIKKLQLRFGSSLDAILLYGSCLRSRKIDDGVVDFYVLVNNYRNAYQKHYLRYFNTWLPPNVFYLELSEQNRIFRAKYAVISTNEFENGNKNWFHSYLWARFAQPVRVLYARDETIRQRIFNSLVHAIIAFLVPTIKSLGTRVVTAEEIWIRGLTLTYEAELRPEKKSRARKLTEQNLGEYRNLTESALPLLVGILEKVPQDDQTQEKKYRCLIDTTEYNHSLRNWRLRRWQGRVLSVLRLAKATFTFKDCIDYAAWKIERHTGVCIEVTPQLRRHPVLFGCKVFWKLFRRGVIR